MNYTNPVISGFYPDPSICRVGEDYYLATSTFEYFPGVPIFHSRDLVYWKKIGHALTRPSQLPLEGVGSSSGIYAPSLRVHDGTFYMVTTNVRGGGHFYVTTRNPVGEWSEPIWVEGKGFDPDLYFEGDKAYFMRQGWGQGIVLQEINIHTGELVGELHSIWSGQEDPLCEAPHIYKIHGKYYLMVAEGGTHRGHMVMVGRSDTLTGPYARCPHNPVLTHRGQVMNPIQATGHADLVEAHDGSWWLVFLGIRQVWGWHHLGRETFLAPVSWTADGWPVVNGGKPVELEMAGPNWAPQPAPAEPVRDDFDGEKLSLCWNYRRNPAAKNYSLTDRPGCLQLRCAAVTLDDDGQSPTLLARRQEHFRVRVATGLEFTPVCEGDEAGLTVIMNERHHYDIGIRKCNTGREVFVRRRIGDLTAVVAAEAIGDGPLTLQIDATAELYTFSYAMDEGSLKTLASGSPRYLSTEVAGGFTGAYFGMYATGHGVDSGTAACFDWFDYAPAEVDTWPRM